MEKELLESRIQRALKFARSYRRLHNRCLYSTDAKGAQGQRYCVLAEIWTAGRRCEHCDVRRRFAVLYQEGITVRFKEYYECVYQEKIDDDDWAGNVL